MNVGMLACYDQAKETVAKLLNDPMIDGPALPTQIGASLVAVSDTEFRTSLPIRLEIQPPRSSPRNNVCRVSRPRHFRCRLI